MNSGFSGNPFWRKWKKGCEPGWCAGSVVEWDVFLPPFSGMGLSALFYWRANLVLLSYFKAQPMPLALPGKSQVSRFSYITPRCIFLQFLHLAHFVVFHWTVSSFALTLEREGPCSLCRRPEGQSSFPNHCRKASLACHRQIRVQCRANVCCLLRWPKYIGYQVPP